MGKQEFNFYQDKLKIKTKSHKPTDIGRFFVGVKNENLHLENEHGSVRQCSSCC